MFKKILIANRGEIALRIMRTCREMGVQTVAVYSEADRGARHVRYADEAYFIGPTPPRESYLQSDRILEVVKKSGAEAVHPGYGFLAECGDFVEACEKAGVIFIGPNSKAMRLLGNKTEARRVMRDAGVPIIPGMEEGCRSLKEGMREADKIGYPLMLKAAAGGGGKGMRIVHQEADFPKAFEDAREEATSAFGDATIYIEKYISHPRHIEFQILADGFGHALHLYERECSIQRRFQKLIEESPCAIMTSDLRQRMGSVAVKAALASGYTNAGTVEFLVDDQRNFYFLEVNARLQVEHPVTEMVTGLDLVKAQLKIVSGEPLTLKQEDVPFRGSAIECRICTEDPYEDFFPSSGRIVHLIEPAGPGVRIESSLFEGQEISLFYDPLVAKLIVWAENRYEAVSRMKRALFEYEIVGIRTTIPFYRRVMEDENFIQGNFDTEYIERQMGGIRKKVVNPEIAAIFGALYKHTQKGLRSLSGHTKMTKGVDPWRMSVLTGMLRRLGGV